MLSKVIASEWRSLPKKTRQTVSQTMLQKIQEELKLSEKFINDASINTKVEHKLKYNVNESTSDLVEFLSKSINGLPILLDIHNYKLESFAQLKKITTNYTLSFPVSSLPEEIELILSKIKFPGVGEYSDCLSFIKHKVDRIIYTGKLGVITTEDGTKEVAALWLNEKIADRLYPGKNTRVILLKHFAGYGGIDLFEKIFFAMALLHEAVHQQVADIRLQGYKMYEDEEERYATLVGVRMLLSVMSVLSNSQQSDPDLEKDLFDVIVYYIGKVRNLDFWIRFVLEKTVECFEDLELICETKYPYNFDTVIFWKPGKNIYHNLEFNFTKKELELFFPNTKKK